MLGKELKKQLSKEDFRSWLSNRRARSRYLIPSKVVKLRHKKREDRTPSINEEFD